MRTRAIRSLAHLQGSASTSRTLNLHVVWEAFGHRPDYATAPLFQNLRLNRAIILKHRMRRNEDDIFSYPRAGGTKVILPLDPQNLRAGGQFFFVGQRGYHAAVESVLGAECDHLSAEVRLLALLDSLPSFDPFLLREALRREGFTAADCYFQVAPADVQRMLAFMRAELEPLVGISFDRDIEFAPRTSVLASKIMSNEIDSELEPLRLGLNLSRQDFEQGVFCWKGFIYYKWTLAELLPRVRGVLEELQAIAPHGHLSAEARRALRQRSDRIQSAVYASLETARTTLGVYETAYDGLAHLGKPAAFREFLLSAPALFAELGERLGALGHIVSFWRFRFPQDQRPKVETGELIDILNDFSDSLNVGAGRAELAA